MLKCLGGGGQKTKLPDVWSQWLFIVGQIILWRRITTTTTTIIIINKKKKTDNLFTCVKIHSKRYHHDSMVEFVIKKRTQSEP